MLHAVSPAVPPEATARVRAYAEREGWRPRGHRCRRVRRPRLPAGTRPTAASSARPTSTARWPRAPAAICSGTNLDDLGDCRPGLQAAQRARRAPPLRRGGDRQGGGARARAQAIGLDDLAELPAAPCLSSRLETGIAVTAGAAAPGACGRAPDQRAHAAAQRCAAGCFTTASRSSSTPPASSAIEGASGVGAAARDRRAAGRARPARHAALRALPHGQRLPPPARRAMARDVTFDFERRERIGLERGGALRRQVAARRSARPSRSRRARGDAAAADPARSPTRSPRSRADEQAALDYDPRSRTAILGALAGA